MYMYYGIVRYQKKWSEVDIKTKKTKNKNKKQTTINIELLNISNCEGVRNLISYNYEELQTYLQAKNVYKAIKQE